MSSLSAIRFIIASYHYITWKVSHYKTQVVIFNPVWLYKYIVLTIKDYFYPMLRLSVIITWKCTYLLMTVKYWCCDVTVTCKSTEYERRTLGARGTAPHVMSVQRARTFSWSHVARASRGAAPFPCSPYLHWSSEQRTHLLQRHLKSPLQTILR